MKLKKQADPNVPTAENEAHYIIPLPPLLPHTATRQDLHHENQMLHDTLCLAEVQLEKDFTQMKLMDSENGHLCKEAYAKQKNKTEKREMTQAHAYLMTGNGHTETDDIWINVKTNIAMKLAIEENTKKQELPVE